MTMTRPPSQHRKPGVPVQAHHWPLVFESAAIAVVATFLTAVVARNMHVHPWVPFTVTLIAGLITLVTVFVVTGSSTLGWVCAGWALTLPGWLLYAGLTTPWSWPAVLGLGVPAGALAAVTLVHYATHTDYTEAQARRHAEAEARREAAELAKSMRAQLGAYETVLANLGADGVRALADDQTPTGHTITLELPTSGKVTLRTLQNLSDNIATAMRLPVGAVAFELGASSGQVLMYLSEHDFLADDLPFPAAWAERTINEPFPLGVQADGHDGDVLLRELAAMLIGMTGAGKSNLINVLIAWLTMCTDCIVFVIDLKGGRLAAPWVQPWVEGKCDRPALDWVATTRAEAAKMLAAVDRVITAREESLEGGSKITPSARQPQIVILCDETTDLFTEGPQIPGAPPGPKGRDMIEVGARITRKQRSEAVMAIWGTQKGTSDFIPSAIKSQCKLRFALSVTSASDAGSVIPDDAAAAKLLAQLTHAGSGLVWRPGRSTPVPTKFYRLDPADDGDMAKILALAERSGQSRPVPDPGAMAALGKDYDTRWERSELFQKLGAQAPPDVQAELTRPVEPARKPLTAREVGDVFAQMMDAEGMAGGKPDPRGRMYALIADKPTFGLSVAEIGTTLDREGIGVDRGTIHRWLREDIAAGKVERIGEAGTAGARYKFPAGAGQ